MDFDPAGNNLDEMLSSSPDVDRWLLELAELGADHWAIHSRWRTGFNATHVRAYTGRSERDGRLEAVIDAWGHYARWREHGTRYNAPERVLSEYLKSIDPDAQINNP